MIILGLPPSPEVDSEALRTLDTRMTIAHQKKGPGWPGSFVRLYSDCCRRSLLIFRNKPQMHAKCKRDLL